MADIAVPYTTASEINSQAGDPNLSGTAVNFDPAVKAPLQPIQDTFNRIDSENFQRQEQLQREKHDILTRQMEMDHQDKVLKYQQSLKEREALFNFFNKNPGVSSANLKDGDGNDMSIPFLPQDQKEIDTDNDSLRKKAFSDVGGFFYGPDFTKDYQDLNTKKRNASIKSIYATQARQLLQTVDDPKERQRINDYQDELQQQPLTEIPHPFVKLPTTTPLVDVSKYKDPKNLESFDEGDGNPNAEYVGILYSADPKVFSEGFKRLNHFKSQPEGQDAQQYTEFQNEANKIAKQRGIPQVDLGGSFTPDGKVIFHDDTYKKQQIAARNMAYATELINNGYLRKPDAENEQKLLKLKAETQRVYAETGKYLVEKAIKEKELEFGKSYKPTAEELKQQQTVKAVKSMYSSVKDIFDGEKTKVDPDYPQYWSRSGIDPAEYNLYTIPKDAADKFIGLEADQVTEEKKDEKGKTTTHTIKGESQKPDKVMLAENKQSGVKELVYIKNGDVVARVPEKEAVINGLKHEAKYEPSRYDDKVSWVEDVYNQAKGGADENSSITKPASDNSEETIRTRLVPITIRRKDGSLVKAMKDPVTGKRYANE